MPIPLYLTVIFALGGYGLRQYDRLGIRRLGTLCYVLALASIGAAIGNWWPGSVIALALPPLALLASTLKNASSQTLPRAIRLTGAFPPSHQKAPQLRELTEEFQEAGFESADDFSLKVDEVANFIRIYFPTGRKLRGAVHIVSQGDHFFHYVDLTSVHADGRRAVSTTFVLSTPLRPGPAMILHPVTGSTDLASFLAAHTSLLAKLRWTDEELVSFSNDHPEQELESEMNRLVEWNIDQGLLKPVDETMCRPTLKGSLRQFGLIIRDLALYS